MPKAADVVKNLRVLADLLEKHGEQNILMMYAKVWFGDKESFCSVAKDFPRPARKIYKGGETGNLDLEFGKLTDDGEISLSVPRSLICRIVVPAQPAQYECEPLLSDEEFEQV